MNLMNQCSMFQVYYSACFPFTFPLCLSLLLARFNVNLHFYSFKMREREKERKREKKASLKVQVQQEQKWVKQWVRAHSLKTHSFSLLDGKIVLATGTTNTTNTTSTTSTTLYNPIENITFVQQRSLWPVLGTWYLHSHSLSFQLAVF